MPFFIAHWLRMYICNHPQVLLHLKVMFIIFVVLYIVSNKLTSLVWVSLASLHIIWFLTKHSGQFSGQSSSSTTRRFLGEVSRSLSICADIAARACSSIIIRWWYDSYRWWHCRYYWYSDIPLSSVSDEGPWSSIILSRVRNSSGWVGNSYFIAKIHIWY